MATIYSFEELKVWQKARVLNQQVYEVIRYELFSKDYKLREQLNGAAGSIMDNIAEGFGRSGNQEFISFLSIAHGSAMETKSQLFRAFDRNYIDAAKAAELNTLIEDISKMLNGFINYLNN